MSITETLTESADGCVETRLALDSGLCRYVTVGTAPWDTVDTTCQRLEHWMMGAADLHSPSVLITAQRQGVYMVTTNGPSTFAPKQLVDGAPLTR